MSKQLSIIIINYNTLALTKQCIASIFRHCNEELFELIVVDNASTKDDPTDLIREFPTIKLIKNNINNGFAGGNNLGIAHASTPHILLLNSDTYFKVEALVNALTILQENPTIGVVSVQLVYENGVYQNNARSFRSITKEILEINRYLLALVPYKVRSQYMLNQFFRGDYNTPCDWVSGAYFMFRKKDLLVLKDHRLDDRFFMYGEDHLWCYQFKKAGFSTYYLSAPKVVHIANASTDRSKLKQLQSTMLQHELIIFNEINRSKIKQIVFKVLFTTKVKMREFLKNFLK
jgi:GT2 family glycosyltransferase